MEKKTFFFANSLRYKREGDGDEGGGGGGGKRKSFSRTEKQ
jgi:hypothetical protein